ncbi:MAG: cupredoxin domain-containing protein [Rudaea sp.]
MNAITTRMLAFAILLAASASASASPHIVNVGGSNPPVFSPQTITIAPGDSVTFVNKGGFHNAVADDGSFRCAHGCDGDGKGGNGNASSTNWIASVTFSQVGTVGYFCEIHGAPGQGMFGTIIVQTPPVPAPADSHWALGLLAAALALAALAGLRRRLNP